MGMATLKVGAIDLPTLPSIPTGIDVPRDILTIEASIDLHKELIKILNQRMLTAEMVRQVQTVSTENTSKLDRVMNTLHKREEGIMNWLQFAESLNEMRLKFIKIYDLENDILKITENFVVKKPTFDLSLKGLGVTYKDFGVQVALGMLIYNSQVKFVTDTKMLAQLFLIQFGGDIMNNSFTGAIKNVVGNLATDVQRREFVRNIQRLQNSIISNLRNCIYLSNAVVKKYIKFDLTGALLDFLEHAIWYKNICINVMKTFDDNTYN